MAGVFYGWWIVIGGFVIQMLNGALLFHAFSAYILPLQAEFAWNRTQVSGAFAMARAESGILGPIQGWLIDRYGTRPIMRLGNVLFAVGFLLLSRIEGIYSFYGAFAIIALGSSLGGFMPITASVTSWFRRWRSITLGVMLAGMGAGGLLVPGVVWFLTEYGWRASAQVSGILMLVLGLPATQLMRRRPDDVMPDGDRPAVLRAEPSVEASDPTQGESPSRRDDLKSAPRPESRPEVSFTGRQAIATSSFWLLALVHGGALLIVGTVLTHQIPHMVEGIGLSPERAASVVAVLVMVTLVGQLAGGFLGDRLNKRLVIFGAMWLHAVAMVVFAYATSAAGALIFTVLHGVAWGVRGTLINAIRADYFGPRYYATITGYNSLMVMIGMTAGPLFSGVIRDLTGDYRYAFLILAGIAVLASVAAVLARPPAVPRTHGSPSGSADRYIT